MDYLEKLKRETSPSLDYIFQEAFIDGARVSVLYNEVLADTRNINDFIMNRLVRLRRKQLKDLENHLPNCNTLVIGEDEILTYLNNGFLILVYKRVYAFEFRNGCDRGVNTITSELSLTGPKDSFNETFNTNLALLRRRIKSSSLKCLTLEIGGYTKTKVGILYVDGIVKKDLIFHIQKNLDRIFIDGVIDSSYLKQSLEKNFNIFPTISMTERPDKCSMALLEGKAVILVDNSPYALILPTLFLDYFHTTDDYFQKSFNTSFIRIIRLLAFIIAVFTPAIYLSVTTRNYSLVPLDLLLMLKAGRTYVPFPAYIEALFMIICFEILKESDLRMSSTSGSAVSILGGLILGDAAVAAGIVSPIMIIVIAISSIAGLIFTSIELGNALRLYKIFLLILGTLFGIYGVLLGFFIMLYNIFSTSIFGYRYLSLDKHELRDSIIKIDETEKFRNSNLTDNIYRGRIK